MNVLLAVSFSILVILVWWQLTRKSMDHFVKHHEPKHHKSNDDPVHLLHMAIQRSKPRPRGHLHERATNVTAPNAFKLIPLISNGVTEAYIVKLPLGGTTLGAQLDTGSGNLVMISSDCSACMPFVREFQIGDWDTSKPTKLGGSSQQFSFLGASFTASLWKSQIANNPITFAAITAMPSTNQYAISVCGLLPNPPSPHPGLPALLSQVSKTNTFTIDLVSGSETLQFDAVDTHPGAVSIPFPTPSAMQKLFGGHSPNDLPYFIIPITGMTINGRSVNVPKYAIIDTGTTVTMLGTAPSVSGAGTVMISFPGGNLTKHFDDIGSNLVANAMFTSPPYNQLFMIGLNMLVDTVMSFDIVGRKMTIRT